MNTSTVHVAVFDTIADWEIGYLTAHLCNGLHQRSPGRFTISTVGPSRQPITTMGGLRITPDITIDELRPEDSAMLVLAGGNTWDTEVMAPFRSAARRFLTAGVPVAAACGATFGLALEGLLDDRAHTSNAAEYLASSGYAGGARYRDEPAVTDGDLITATGIEPVEFARAVFARLECYEPAALNSWFKLYGLHDPAGFFELMAG